MRKNRVTSSILMVCVVWIGPWVLLSLTGCFVVIAANGATKTLIMLAVNCLCCLLIVGLAALVNLLFSCFGKRRVLIEKGYITYMDETYPISEETRLIYCRCCIDSILRGYPGELSLIINNKELKLGQYFRFEINRMRKLVPIRQSLLCPDDAPRSF